LKKIIIFPVLLYSILATGQPAWKQDLRYQLEVKLDDKLQTLDGIMKLRYINNSSDTLHYIWFHVWPNAYRNDRSSYSEQLLQNGKTGFYFSDKESKGYINQLEFRVDSEMATVQDHPEYIDVVKLILLKPLAKGDSVLVSASFHVKLPFNFSGTGHVSHNYQVSNWYPEPAVYDRKGWHPLPFLEQGGAYHESADYNVDVQIPVNYMIAAGSLPESSQDNTDGSRSYRFSLKNANSFSWVADKHLRQKKDSVQLESGKIIALDLFYFSGDSSIMQMQLRLAKHLIQQLSHELAEYPYSGLTIIETLNPQEQSFSGMIQLDKSALRRDPENELRKAMLGQWFQAIILNNERSFAWLSKGFISYFNRKLQPVVSKKKDNWTALKDDRLWLRVAEKEKTTQPVNTASEELSRENYWLIAGTKSALWFESLENTVGKMNFDKSMRIYFDKWAFGHPYPEDLKMVFQKNTGASLDSVFAKLNTCQSLFSPVPAKKLKPAFIFSAIETDKYQYINIAPAIGYNRYDQVMLGGMINNFNLPENNFQFLFIPLYATGSKTLEGTGRISYSWYPEKNFRKVTLGLNGSRFSSNSATDSTGLALFESFSKIVPYLRLDLKKKFARSTVEKWIDFKSYLITEKIFTGFAVSSKDSLNHPNAIIETFRYVNQLSFNIRDARVLYPDDARLELQQTDLFYRINLSSHYFFNYPAGGGMRVRFFAAKFGAWNPNNHQDLTRYEPKLLGVTGDEDYTYDQYFIGRSASYAIENSSVANAGLAAQQISIRDGGLKLRIDAYDYAQGRSADWVSALNFSTSLPQDLFPVPLPVRIFFDVGTYAEAWKPNAQTSRFLYTGGIQLSLFRNLLNIYAPLIYSSDFHDLIKTVGFAKRITFSIDIQNLDHINAKSLSDHEFRQ
jgi:hypothetical protein